MANASSPTAVRDWRLPTTAIEVSHDAHRRAHRFFRELQCAVDRPATGMLSVEVSFDGVVRASLRPEGGGAGAPIRSPLVRRFFAESRAGVRSPTMRNER
jgi:hypothetical protein